MSVTVDPYWRVKTKPCEFYRKGRCLFGEDRCNFLHVMNDWNPDESTFIESKPLQAAPVVKIFPNTPPSASLHSIQSPPRSPRTTNLLLALKGIIRDEEEQEEYIDDLSIEAVDDYDNDSPRTTKQTVQQIDTNVDGSNFCDPVSTLNDEAEHSPPSPTHSGLLSPVEFSDLQLRHFSYLHSNNHSRNPSLDPGFYDPIGTPHSQWVSPSPMVLSPPRSPALSSTFELLASPFGSPSTRLIANPGAGIMSPRLGVFGPRVTVPPSPLASKFDVSEEEDEPVVPDLGLDSPTEYYQKKKDAERNSGPEQAKEEEKTTQDLVEEEGDDDDDGDYTGALTARWDAEDQDTVRPFFLEPAPPPRPKFRPNSAQSPTEGQFDHISETVQVREEVEEALRRRSTSPLDYFRTPETVRPPPEFSPEEVEADSTAHVPVSPSPLVVDDDDETAQLAYLAGRLEEEEVDEVDFHHEEDDTINSLYDVYSDIDSESEHAEEGEDENEDENESQNDTDGDVCISRALPPRPPPLSHSLPPSHSPSPSHSLPPSVVSPPTTSSFQSPSTILPQSIFTPPPRTSFSSTKSFRLSSPPTARVFTPPVPAPSTPPALSLHRKTISTSSSKAPFSSSKYSPPSSLSTARTLTPPAQFSQPPAFVPTDTEEHDDQVVPLPGLSASGRSGKLRPLRLSTIVTDSAPVSIVASSSPDALLSAEPKISPDFSSSIEPLSHDSRSSIASTSVLSASASTSESAFSNNYLLSSSLSSSLTHSGQIRHGSLDLTIPSSIPLSAPLAVTSGRSMQTPPTSALVSSSSIPSSQKRSSIYYIRDDAPRDSQSSVSGSQEPKSAPLTRPPTWEGKDSIRSGSVRSFSTSASRRLSRVGASETRQERARQSQTPNPLSPVTSQRSSAASLSVPPHPHTGMSENAPVHHSTSPSSVHGPSTSPARTSTQSRPSTPHPTLLFAIASDDPKEVERVLEHGDDNTKCAINANDTIGPQAQSALEFTLENEGLKNKLGIVKKLLGYGADPSKAKLNDSKTTDETDLDPATRYYLDRANTATTRRIDALMQRSVFRPLVRMRFGIIGQDRALEQLYRVLSIHSEKISKSPVVVFLCGPSGHGKSMLAHQFGLLLEVPIHTVNMTTLRTADDIWRSYSISSEEDAPPCTLVEFLANNEGKRCVVVLDEIEKTEHKALWSLLVPWELGRCTFEANSRTIDVRNVIWVGTSNIGNDLVLDYHKSLQRPEETLTRNEYVELMGTLRPHVSDQLGASVLSRVSAILPFVPFTTAEKRAIASEFLQESAAEHLVQGLSREQTEKVVEDSLKDFVPSEGARSLYRGVSNLLIDSMDF